MTQYWEVALSDKVHAEEDDYDMLEFWSERAIYANRFRFLHI